MTATGLNGTLNAQGGYGLAFTVAAGVAAAAILLLLPVREDRSRASNRRSPASAISCGAATCYCRRCSPH